LLDAFTLDSLPEKQRPAYLKEVFRLSHPATRNRLASQLFLSVMSRRNPETAAGFFRSDTTKELVTTYNRKDIARLYHGHFKIAQDQETDFAYDGKKAYIDEYLLERLP
jgi:hypothetical protein